MKPGPDPRLKPWVVKTRNVLDARAPGRLLATCWCEEHVVNLSVETLREGLTRSCGLPDCKPDLVGLRS